MIDGPQSGHGLYFHVLGPFVVARDGDPISLGGTRKATTLAALLRDANRVVPAASLVAAVWGEHPPDAAENSLQVNVSALRRALAPDGPRAASPITTWGSGYQLIVDDSAHDVAVLATLRADARTRIAASDRHRAAALLRKAEGLWRGPSLADLRGSLFIDEWASSLDELRRVVLEERIEAEMAAGSAADLVPELTGLTRENPLRESLWGWLMRALYWTGRQAEALEAYTSLRRTLDEELGVEPGPQLRQLHKEILDQSLSPLSAPLRGSPPQDATERESTVQPPNAWLITSEGQAHPVVRVPFTIGRDSGCDLPLGGTLVSRRHAQIVWQSDRFAVIDLGSTNGTRLNGVTITQAFLEPDDIVSIGGLDLQLRIDQ